MQAAQESQLRQQNIQVFLSAIVWEQMAEEWEGAELQKQSQGHGGAPRAMGEPPGLQPGLSQP